MTRLIACLICWPVTAFGHGPIPLADLVQCWDRAALPVAASKVKLTLSVVFDAGGWPVETSIKAISAVPPAQGPAHQAYKAARDAVLSCSGEGYIVPADVAGTGVAQSLTFNPEGMRLR